MFYDLAQLVYEQVCTHFCHTANSSMSLFIHVHVHVHEYVCVHVKNVNLSIHPVHVLLSS